jgi:biotin synthase-like enzyme
MTNYIRPGEVYRNIERKKRAEARSRFFERIKDVGTGIVIGVLIGIGIYMIH